jgi:DNA-binding CsgD family transcriptional regulator
VEQLVGREAEVEAVHDALARPAPVAIVLEGDAGIGKTALWRAGLAEAEIRGLRTLVARPGEAETGLSHASLGDLLAPIADEVAGELPEPQREALDVALLRVAPGVTSVSPRAVGAATLTALRVAAERTALLLAVDDIQWMDPASADALRFALRRLEGEDVVLFATRRLENGRAPLDVGFGDERLVRIGVGPLDPDALRSLIRTRLDARIPQPALARLAEVSGGNPYHALELARAAMRQSGGDALSAEFTLPESMYAVLQERLREFSPGTLEALGTIAAMSRPTLTAAAAIIDAHTLDAAFDAGVLHEDGDAIRFDHPLLAEAAYRVLAPSRRRAVHERLAATTTDAEERARHLAAASTDANSSVASAIAKGAEAAAERGGLAAAAELLEASARLEPEPELAARRRITAVGHHMSCGDLARAVALGRALAEQLPAGPMRSRALVAWAQADTSDLAGSIDLAEQAVAEAGDDHEALIDALLWQSVFLVYADRQDEGNAALSRARDLSRPDDPRDLRVQVITQYAYLAHLGGEPASLELARKAAELEGNDLIPSAGWGGGLVLGRVLTSVDQLDDARPILAERRRRATELGDDEGREALSMFLAEVEMRAGRLDTARGYARELVAARSMVATYQGDVELARKLADRGLARSEAQGDALVASANRTALGFLEFSLGHNEAAVQHFQPAVERFLRGDGGDPGLRHNIIVPDAVEALVALGRLGEAEALLGAWERAGETFDRARIHATAARCRALLAAASGDLDAALHQAKEALEHHRGLPVPFERARTLIVLGTLHRRAKHKAVARTALAEAVEILEGMGAPIWAERARTELGRIGGRAASDGLTPTERRVADLVAEGRSNKEVAEALFVSVRTVEANLTRVYAKLGIRSRTELAATRPASDGRSRSPAPQRAQPS